MTATWRTVLLRSVQWSRLYIGIARMVTAKMAPARRVPSAWDGSSMGSDTPSITRKVMDEAKRYVEYDFT